MPSWYSFADGILGHLSWKGLKGQIRLRKESCHLSSQMYSYTGARSTLGVFPWKGLKRLIYSCVCVWYVRRGEEGGGRREAGGRREGDGSAVKSIFCSCRGSRFSSQHMHSRSPPSIITPFPEDSMSFWLRSTRFLCWAQTYKEANTHTPRAIKVAAVRALAALSVPITHTVAHDYI